MQPQYEAHPPAEVDDVRPLVNANPFGSSVAISAPTEIAKSRESSEVQAAIVLARQFPRNAVQAMDGILNAFQRPTLAEKAMYQYARGGQDITGPSIRAAEAIAIGWGNVQYAVRELEQKNGSSSVEAFAWDVQSNTRSARTFIIEHKRHTKKGSYALEDPRDIYELVANNGARRLRACILSVIPADVVEAAMRQAEQTLRSRVKITPEVLGSLLEKFQEHGITKQQIEQRIQRRFDAITPAQIVNLGNVYNSLNDGMSAAADWFEIPTAAPTNGSQPASRAEQLRQRTGVDAKPAPEVPAPAATPADNGPTEGDLIEAKVGEFVDAANTMPPSEVLSMVKRQAAARGIVEERDLAELYRRASGKITFTKPAFAAVMREILKTPMPAGAPVDLSGHQCQIHGTPVLECTSDECREKARTYIAMAGQPSLLSGEQA